MPADHRPILLSGIQPSGELMIGHYLGALKNWVGLQADHDCLFMLVDLHAITVRQDPAELRRRCLDFLALYVACGIDPSHSTVFVQSHVPTHAELAWVLNCFTYMGELGRMTQFKEKSQKQELNVSAGLFNYPVLMAADILLYQSHLVPVGEDQKQHLELTRDIAMRFNNLYGETFRVPECFIPPVGARIMSLQDPTSKMSKSDPNPRSYVALLDPPDLVRSKIKKAVTDSGTEVVFGNDRPAVSNLMTIYSSLTGHGFPAIEERYQGKGYADFKADLAEIVVEFLRPIQDRYHAIRSDKSELTAILKRGAEAALARSRPTVAKVYKKLGFIAAS
ncbi:MAG: tryptophan--tRNA ligase [Acidobacteria bacterium]|nr:tryptophan--tRNA ligase [Acidobacteriota bacterium]